MKTMIRAILGWSEYHGWPAVFRAVAKAMRTYNPCEADGPDGTKFFDDAATQIEEIAHRLATRHKLAMDEEGDEQDAETKEGG
jgi:hypothetical protein